MKKWTYKNALLIYSTIMFIIISTLNDFFYGLENNT